MKKFLAMLLALVMALSLVACGGDKDEAPAADLKVGLICVHDINSGYDAAHIEGL